MKIVKAAVIMAAWFLLWFLVYFALGVVHHNEASTFVFWPLRIDFAVEVACALLVSYFFLSVRTGALLNQMTQTLTYAAALTAIAIMGFLAAAVALIGKFGE